MLAWLSAFLQFESSSPFLAICMGNWRPGSRQSPKATCTALAPSFFCWEQGAMKFSSAVTSSRRKCRKVGGSREAGSGRHRDWRCQMGLARGVQRPVRTRSSTSGLRRQRRGHRRCPGGCMWGRPGLARLWLRRLWRTRVPARSCEAAERRRGRRGPGSTHRGRGPPLVAQACQSDGCSVVRADRPRSHAAAAPAGAPLGAVQHPAQADEHAALHRAAEQARGAWRAEVNPSGALFSLSLSLGGMQGQGGD